MTPVSIARPILALIPDWTQDPTQIAELWSWLDDQCWPTDGGRAPNPATFMGEAHRWSEERERMLREERAA